jgi:hypothetical protein
MKHICLAILFLGVTVNIFGQIKPISKQQYDADRNSAFTKAATLLRREVHERATYKAVKVDTIRTLTIESFPNGDNRWNSVTERDGQIIDRFQLIYLGKYEYRKEGETAWKKRCVKDCSESEKGIGGMTLQRGTEPPKVEQFLISGTTMLGQTANVYVFYRVYQVGALLNFYDEKMWVGSNGLILRQESTTSDVFPANQTESEIVSYEYNPADIKPLEAPIK